MTDSHEAGLVERTLERKRGLKFELVSTCAVRA